MKLSKGFPGSFTASEISAAVKLIVSSIVIASLKSSQKFVRVSEV